MLIKIAETGLVGFLHGNGSEAFLEAPGTRPPGWWAAVDSGLPDFVEVTSVRLLAQDGGQPRGTLYRRGHEDTVVVLNHPRADFTSHYLIPDLLAGGVAVFGGLTRNFNNDSNCIHEHLLSDLAAEVRYLRTIGFKNVVLCGNSGGGSLAGFYQAQAATPPPHRLTDTAAGDPYDLNLLDLPLADAVVLVGAHVGEGLFGMDNLDPSVTDESNPLSCDPHLDMYNPENGYRKPPEVSVYKPEFLQRYRQAQRDRCARIDAMARQDIERRRFYTREMQKAGFEELPLQEQNFITRMATASQYLRVARVSANPGYTDLSIDPSTRIISTLLGPDPHTMNYVLGGFAAVMTPEAWLSTWSGISSRAALPDNVAKFDQPLLIVNFTGDAGILPHESKLIFGNSISPDKTIVEIDADHFGNARVGPSDAPIHETASLIVEWLNGRF